MNWTVSFTRKAAKSVQGLPHDVRAVLALLVTDLERTGPTRGDWPNYSKLSDGSHHCHLKPKWVVVWLVTDKEMKILEITYAGSRKDAPY
jgi:mRNA-degrading endonuclease YafQ of YafQ-DinJ toxin-antitoxin module